MVLPVDLLVIEHKLILQAVDQIQMEIEQIQANGKVNTDFIVRAVDFFRSYADRFHHGKEEGILFKELSQKQMNDSDKKFMLDLTLEHASARRTVTELEKANENCVYGQKQTLNNILHLLADIVKLYRAHIEKEDNHFFYPCMKYFSAQETKEMQTKFLNFNQNFTDEKYKKAVENLRA